MSESPADAAAEVRLNRLLNLLLEAAVDLLGVQGATASACHEGVFVSVAATDPRMLAVDDAQYQAGQGPCITVLDPHDPIVWTDADTNPDWVSYHEAAVDAGIVTSLSVHVPTEQHLAASLNLYARKRRVFQASEITAAESVADQLGLTLQSIDSYRAAARLASGLGEAMRGRAVIEQAKGILMADRHVDAEEAFAMLVKLSRNSNMKLRSVAARLVEARSSHDEPYSPS